MMNKMMACMSPPETEVKTGFVEELQHFLKTEDEESSGLKEHINGIHHKTTPPVDSIIQHTKPAVQPKLSTMCEEENEDDIMEEPWDTELSAEAQAHNISMFLSTSTSSDSASGEEPVSETVITNVYRDPLEFCMEGIEEMARKILQTGKLAINGEPGDMAKIQPALFNLQASEKELPQLIPQMLQMAFFYQGKPVSVSLMDSDDDEPFITVTDQDEALANGNIRLAVPVDTAIYALLRSHCAKGARQAEEMINTALRSTYTPSQVRGPGFSTMPPIVKFHSASCPSFSRNSSHLSTESSNRTEGNRQKLRGDSRTKKSSSSLSHDARSSLSTCGTSYSSLPRSETSDTNLASRKNSDDSTGITQQQNMGMTSHPSTESSESTLRGIKEEEDPSTPKSIYPPVVKSLSNQSKVRKISTALQPPMMSQRSRVDSTGSDVSVSDTQYGPTGPNHWCTSIFDNNTIVAQYGSNPYPIVWWEPSFKIDFRLSTSVGLLSGTVTGIDPSKPEVTLKVFNSSAKQVGFAIRSHRQSTVFSSYVVYPQKGLKILEPYKSWEDNVEFYPNSSSDTEMFVIDFFFCTMDTKPIWNVIRKYAIMKAEKSANNLRRASKRRMSHLQLPGIKEVKKENLELVLSHGLQCVVKGKLNEAEIIFSQALFLPDFQRVAIKSFLYICLAVIANKRIKQGQAISPSPLPVMVAVESSSKLVSICEQGPGSVNMPYTIQLVKQLRKELNLQKIMKDSRKRVENRKSSSKLEDTEEFNVTQEGGELLFKDTTVTIPPEALSQSTSISLSLADSKHLIPMLKASGWEKVVQVATAINIECNPPVDYFSKPIQITTELPEDNRRGPNSLIRLMHSNYLRHWEDITDDVLSKISIDGNKVSIETNLPGWLAVSMVQFDASMIAQMVLKSISMEPIMLRLSAFAFIDTERKSIQVAIFVVPCKGSEEPIHKDVEKPKNFVPVSFPHVVQAYPNEKLRLEILGTFEPDKSLGESNLLFEMDVQQKHNQIHTKWLKSTSTSADVPLSGKLKISSCRNSSDSWESIAHISLSMRSGFTSSSGSSASDQ